MERTSQNSKAYGFPGKRNLRIMSKKPNIILFLSDDHAPWTLPCYGNSEVISPNFDKIAEEGVMFSNAFTPGPVCSPGRACLLTGRTASQHGIHDWISMNDPACQDRDWLTDEVTLAQLLQMNGYNCGLSGKWHLGQCDRTPRGYDWYFGFPDFERPVHIGNCNYVFNNHRLKINGNRTEITTDYAIKFLQNTEDDKPFSLQIGYIATHSPFTGQDPELIKKYDDASFRDIKLDKAHDWSWNEDFPENHDITQEEARLRHKNQYAAVTDIDQNMGRIINYLEESGKLENTIIIYTSDHGLSLGQHGFWGKGNGTRPLNMYDISIRVPLLIYGNRLSSPGKVIDKCVDHLDTFAAICEIAGCDPLKVKPGGNYPGQSFLRLLEDETSEWENIKFGEYGDLRMIRTPEFKLVKRYPEGPDELFNLQEDPDEKNNLIDLPESENIKQALTVKLDDYFKKYSDPLKSGLKVKELPRHNAPQKPSQKISSEGWRDGIRERVIEQ